MKQRVWLAGLLVLLLASAAAAQREEFLTDGEISLIREAQEPNKRLKHYVDFAQQRLAEIEKALAGNEPKRGDFIHQYLREYDSIIDAVDRNVEQALTRRDLARKGLEIAVKATPEFLKLLQGFRARNPKDLDQYRFILDQAIEDTESSIGTLRAALDKQPKDRRAEREARKEAEEQQRRRAEEEGSKEKQKESGPPRKRPGNR